MSNMMGRKQRMMTQPISQIFKFFTSQVLVQIWLFQNTKMRIEGKIRGFDEYMNVVLDEAHEVYLASKSKTALGRILLKGENIALITAVPTGA